MFQVPLYAFQKFKTFLPVASFLLQWLGDAQGGQLLKACAFLWMKPSIQLIPILGVETAVARHSG